MVLGRIYGVCSRAGLRLLYVCRWKVRTWQRRPRRSRGRHAGAAGLSLSLLTLGVTDARSGQTYIRLIGGDSPMNAFVFLGGWGLSQPPVRPDAEAPAVAFVGTVESAHGLRDGVCKAYHLTPSMRFGVHGKSGAIVSRLDAAVEWRLFLVLGRIYGVCSRPACACFTCRWKVRIAAHGGAVGGMLARPAFPRPC